MAIIYMRSTISEHMYMSSTNGCIPSSRKESLGIYSYMNMNIEYISYVSNIGIYCARIKAQF